MNDRSADKPILVIGGTGKTGSRVAERLQRRGLPVRIGSRSGTPAFDWNDRNTWAPALEGIRAAYVSYQPDLAVPGAVEAVAELTGIARRNGVTRLVLLSGRGEEEAQAAERVLRDSGADWTIVRASWFAQNFSESFLVDAVRAGEVALPVGAVGEPFVDADDIADVVVAALTDDRHIGRLYEVTGPRLLSFADAVAEIAEACGRPVGFRQVPADAYAAAMAEQGVPDDYATLVMYLFTTVLDGRNARTADGVRQALGRAPRDFTDYARRTAAAGVWETRP